MSGFTPGPYLLDGITIYALDEKNEVNRFSASLSGGHVAYWRRQSNVQPTSAEELQATARLFHAAPDLYEAVQNLMGLFDNAVYRRRLAGDTLYPEAIKQARDALHRANPGAMG